MSEAIYFKTSDDSQLYLSLFVASTLHWVTKNISIIQQTTFPAQQGTGLVIRTPSPSTFTLNVHIPYWVNAAGVSIVINGVPLKATFTPSSIFPISRQWMNNDIVNISVPFTLHLDAIIDDPTLVAVMYGPLVLAGLTQVSHTLPISTSSQLPSILKPVTGNPLQFIASVDGGKTTMTMQPLYTLTTQQYGVYWKLRPN